MFERRKIQKPEDYFLPLSGRREKGVYFYRINSHNPAIEEFLINFYETARRFGVIIEGRIQNPDEKNLSYFEEVMGLSFALREDFFADSLKKWLPRMDARQRNNVASCICRTLNGLKAAGKN